MPPPSPPCLAPPPPTRPPASPSAGCANAGQSPFHCPVSGPHGGGHRPSPWAIGGGGGGRCWGHPKTTGAPPPPVEGQAVGRWAQNCGRCFEKKGFWGALFSGCGCIGGGGGGVTADGVRPGGVLPGGRTWGAFSGAPPPLVDFGGGGVNGLGGGGQRTARGP